MVYADPAFEARRKSIVSGNQGGIRSGVAPQGSYIDSSFQERRARILAAPRPQEPQQPTQIAAPTQIAEPQKGIFGRVVDEVKGLSLKGIGQAFVAGAKQVPGQVKTATGVIMGSIVQQNKAVNDFFEKHPVAEAAASVVPFGIGANVQARKTVRQNEGLKTYQAQGEQKTLEKAGQIREAGFQSQQKAAKAYEATRAPSQGLQRIAEMVALNLPQMATTIALTTGTAIVTKNPLLAEQVGLSTSFGMNAGEVYNSAREYGLSDSQALPLAQLGGVVMGFLDFIPLERLIKKTEAVEVVKKSIIRKVTDGVISFGIQGGLEAVTENLQEIVENAIARTYDQNQKLFDMDQLRDVSLVSFLTGGLVDATVGGVTGILGPKASDTEVLSNIQDKIEGALSTSPEKRTDVQKQIVEAVSVREMSPDQAMQLVIDNNLTNTPEGNAIVKSVAQAKQENKDIRLSPSEDESTLRVELVEKQQFMRPSEPVTAPVAAKESVTGPSQEKAATGQVTTGVKQEASGPLKETLDQKKAQLEKKVLPVATEAYQKGETRDFSFDPDSTKNEGRFNLAPATDFKSFFRKKSDVEGVSFVMGVDGQGKERVQAVRFDKRVFSEDQAKQWWSQNKADFSFNKAEIKTTVSPPSSPVATIPANKEKTVAVPAEKPGTPRPGTKKSESKLAEHVRNQLSGEIKEEELLYQGITLEKAAERATDIVNNDTQLAQDIIDGYAPAPNDTTRAAVMMAMAETARKDGNYKLQAELVKQRFFMQNRFGQEIVTERLVNDLSSDRFIKDVLSARLNNVVKKQRELLGFVVSEANNKIKTQAEIAKKKIDKVVLNKLESAQQLIDSLAC